MSNQTKPHPAPQPTQKAQPNQVKPNKPNPAGPQKKLPAAVPDIPIDQGTGELRPQTLEQMIYWAKVLFESGLVPDSYENAQAVLIALQTARERNLRPMELIQNSYVVNNKLRVYGSYPKGLVLRSGKCHHYREYLIDKDYMEICLKNKNLGKDPFAGVCETKRAGMTEMEVTTFSVPEAQRAGLLRKDNWVKYLGRMLLSKARMMNLDYNFGDIVSGLNDYDEDFDRARPIQAKVLPKSNIELEDDLDV